MNLHAVTKEFEKELCIYTGAPYAVAVNSCTMALLLAIAWHLRNGLFWSLAGEPMRFTGPPARQCIEIPKRTYVGVGMSICHAGAKPVFRDEEWRGAYQLKPLPVWDFARWFTSGMYRYQPFSSEVSDAIFPSMLGQMQCLSFHAAKILGDTQGGAILHDSPEADAWLRRARFDGRAEGVAPKDDTFTQIGYHCYLSPDVAARLLWKLSVLPKHNEPLPWGPGTDSDYPDLSQMECFK